MKTYKLLFAILTMALLTSCIAVADYLYGVGVRYTNDTEHHIVLMTDNKYYEYVEILPGKSNLGGILEGNHGGNVDKSDAEDMLLHAIPRTITVIWDDEYSITCNVNESLEYLVDVNNYSYLGKKKKWYWEYGYTFTEEDYEYAKMYGEKIVAE